VPPAAKWRSRPRARALEVVGERWSLLIIRDALFAGSTRYSDFQRSLGVATNILRTTSTYSSTPGSCVGTGTPSSPSCTSTC
jgi:hypothetical protein